MFKRSALPRMPYVQAKYQGSKQRPTAIIIDATFTESTQGAALGIANTWHRPSRLWEHGHYVLDEATRFRCTPDRIVSGIDPWSDKGALRIAVCANPSNGVTFWDLNHQPHYTVLKNAAKLVAELSTIYGIRVRILDDNAAARWRKFRLRHTGGIVIETTSGFPYEEFVKEVEVQKALLKST